MTKRSPPRARRRAGAVARIPHAPAYVWLVSAAEKERAHRERALRRDRERPPRSPRLSARYAVGGQAVQTKHASINTEFDYSLSFRRRSTSCAPCRTATIVSGTLAG